MPVSSLPLWAIKVEVGALRTQPGTLATVSLSQPCAV